MRYFTPGPTQLHPKVPEFIKEALSQDICSISHRSPKFDGIYASAANSVRNLLGAPKKMHVFFLGSGTEAMERIVQNCAVKNTLHFVNGAFSERFFQTAKELGKNARQIHAELGEGFDFDHAEMPAETELICVTHNETSTGVMTPPSSYEWIKRRYPHAFLAVDIVSSAPYPKLDFNVVDCCFFSVQKCFGLPAGLGVLLVNDAAIARSIEILSTGNSIGCHHNFPTLLSFESKSQTPTTPNVLGIYLLSRVAAEYETIGADKIRAETEAKASLLYNFLESRNDMEAFVTDKQLRSQTVITIEVRGGAKNLVQHLKTKQIEVGAGYGSLKDNQIRVANFPMHTRSDMDFLVDCIGKYKAA
jgi:phosphoserine aminotransferase